MKEKEGDKETLTEASGWVGLSTFVTPFVFSFALFSSQLFFLSLTLSKHPHIPACHLALPPSSPPSSCVFLCSFPLFVSLTAFFCSHPSVHVFLLFALSLFFSLSHCQSVDCTQAFSYTPSLRCRTPFSPSLPQRCGALPSNRPVCNSLRSPPLHPKFACNVAD